MVEVKDHIVDTYWIAKATDNSVIHYGCVPVGGVVESGQDELELFTDEQPWIDRLDELEVEHEITEQIN